VCVCVCVCVCVNADYHPRNYIPRKFILWSTHMLSSRFYLYTLMIFYSVFSCLTKQMYKSILLPNRTAFVSHLVCSFTVSPKQYLVTNRYKSHNSLCCGLHIITNEVTMQNNTWLNVSIPTGSSYFPRSISLYLNFKQHFLSPSQNLKTVPTTRNTIRDRAAEGGTERRLLRIAVTIDLELRQGDATWWRPSRIQFTLHPLHMVIS
jgi:hypothetical protein